MSFQIKSKHKCHINMINFLSDNKRIKESNLIISQFYKIKMCPLGLPGCDAS